MLAHPAPTTRSVDVEHAYQIVAGLLRFDDVLQGEDGRHVPYLVVLLDLRERFLVAFVGRLETMHDGGGEVRVHEADLRGGPRDHLIVVPTTAHGDVGAAISLPHDHGDGGHRDEGRARHHVHDPA